MSVAAHAGTDGTRRWRWRGLAAVAAALLALPLAMVGFPAPASQAAQGQQWQTGVPWAGVLQTDQSGGQRVCSVTVVEEWLAITAKHCGAVNPKLKLNVPSRSTPGHDYAVRRIVPNRDLDVQAIYLKDRTGLAVTPLRASVDPGWFYGWGYGTDLSSNDPERLARADFDVHQECPADTTAGGRGDLCWPTTATASVCSGDSGGPVIQNGAIIGMITTGFNRPPGSTGCGSVFAAAALTVKAMQPWLDQMINDANPWLGAG